MNHLGGAGDAGHDAEAHAGPAASRFTHYNEQNDKKALLKGRRRDPLIKKGDAAVKKARKLWGRGTFNPAMKLSVQGMPLGVLAPGGTAITAYSADEGKWVFGKLHRIVLTRDAACADFVVVLQGEKVFASPFELVRGGHVQVGGET